MLTTTSMFGCFHFNCRGNKNALEDILEKSCESENEISEEENLGRGMRSSSYEMKNSSKISYFSFVKCRYI